MDTKTEPLFKASKNNGIFEDDIVAAFQLYSNSTDNNGATSLREDGSFNNFPNWFLAAGEEEYIKACRKCGGSGQHWAQHIDNGACFRCGGCGEEPRVRPRTLHQLELAAASLARAEAKKEAERVAKIAERDAKIALYASQGNEEVIAALHLDTDEDLGNDFLETMRSKLYKFGSLTENQTAAIRRGLHPEMNEGKTPVLTGRVVITGTVRSTKSYDNDYGTAYKMLVEDNRGFKVFGSIPSALWDEVEFLGSYRKNSWGETDGVMQKLVGMEITFTATVEESRDDKSFGIFKRPAKASIVE